MLNKAAKSIFVYQYRQHSQLALGDLPTLLENWQQAVSTFKSLYDSLGQCIQLKKQLLCDDTFSAEGQRSIRELEKIRLTMMTELRYLLNDMNEPQGFTLTAGYIERLHRHTLRLQKQNQRIQRMVN